MKDPTPTDAAQNGSDQDRSHQDRPNDKAADPASDVDRVWFDKNPDRVHRLRNLIPFESKEPLGLPPLGMTWRILVTRTVGGGRLRLPVLLPTDVANETVDDDQQLALMFDRIAPPNAVTICRTAMNKKSQKKLAGPQERRRKSVSFGAFTWFDTWVWS